MVATPVLRDPDGASVLLVQPYPDDRELYTRVLHDSGFDTIAVDNSVSALVRAADADLIVTGIRLHPFDGIELIRRLRHDERTKPTPILVLTACALEMDRRRAQVAGCDGFLVKPCLPEHLVREIRRLVAYSRALREQAARTVDRGRLLQAKSRVLLETAERLHSDCLEATTTPSVGSVNRIDDRPGWRYDVSD